MSIYLFKYHTYNSHRVCVTPVLISARSNQDKSVILPHGNDEKKPQDSALDFWISHNGRLPKPIIENCRKWMKKQSKKSFKNQTFFKICYVQNFRIYKQNEATYFLKFYQKRTSQIHPPVWMCALEIHNTLKKRDKQSVTLLWHLMNEKSKVEHSTHMKNIRIVSN